MPKFANLSILKQALIALVFDIGGILAGRIALTLYPYFEAAPWVLSLFPPVLSVRGSIGGILAGKLATMLHIGEVEPRLRGNTQEFYSLIWAIFTLTFVNGIGIGGFAFFANYLSGSAEISHAPYFIAVPSLTCLVTVALATPTAYIIATQAFRKGMDPDIILYPMMSTVDDVLLTVCYVLVVSLAMAPQGLLGIFAVLLPLGAFFLAILMKQKRETVFRKILAEGAPTVMTSSILGALGGVGLASIKEEIERHPSVLILYPALIDTLGDIGSILGSMETTKLALGYGRSFREALKEMLTDLVPIEAAAAVMHVLFGLVAFLVAQGTGLTADPILLMAIALISNLLSFHFISVFSLAIALQTFKRGLDPDNFVIPLVTSVSDVGATLALMAALLFLSV